MDPAAPRSGCLDVDEILAFLGGALSGAAGEDIRGHLYGCETCRRWLAELSHGYRSGVDAHLTTFAVGTVVGDRYEIKRFVAQGGMGEVYEVFDRLLEENVALKTITLATLDDAHALGRLRKEVSLARQVTHRNVCRIIDFAVHTVSPGVEVPCLTMELLHGEPLSLRLARGPLGIAESERIIGQLLDGVEAIHAAGIVHRDLKADNVFLARGSGGTERVVILDLGLARTFDAVAPRSDSAAGHVGGTPEYMAPEQRRGAAPAPAMDIYALGVMTCEMLTRHRANTRDGVAGAIPEIPKSWRAAVAKCLEVVPQARPPSVAALRGALGVGRPRSGRRGWRAVLPNSANLFAWHREIHPGTLTSSIPMFRAVLLTAAGVALGFGSNALRSDGVRLASFAAPTTCAAPAVAAPPVLVLPPAEAFLLCGDPGVLIADARPAARFAVGHVARAVHLPCGATSDAAAKAVAFAAGKHTVIVYGDTTDEAKPVAEALRQRFAGGAAPKIIALAGGFPAWDRAGLACAAGPCADCKEHEASGTSH